MFYYNYYIYIFLYIHIIYVYIASIYYDYDNITLYDGFTNYIYKYDEYKILTKMKF